MIDWTTVIVPFLHTRLVRGGLITAISEDGEITWTKPQGKRIAGSHESAVQVKTSADHAPGSHLWISGNPTKFLQGHNVTGSDDLCRLVADMSQLIVESLGYEVTPDQYDAWRQGHFSLKMVDINFMRHCGTREQARAILHQIAHTGCMRHSGRGEFSGTTLYFSKKSRRRAIKFYVKGDELERGGKKHRLPESLDDEKRQALHAIANDALRIELRLMSLELKDLRLQDGRNWTGLDVHGLFVQYVERIQFSANVQVTKQVLLSLPKHLQRTYALWKEDIDLRIQIKPATWYRQRRELLIYGIDIGARRSG